MYRVLDRVKPARATVTAAFPFPWSLCSSDNSRAHVQHIRSVGHELRLHCEVGIV